MSRRPSSIIRTNTTANTSSGAVCKSCNYAIIGDTTAAVLYANRLLNNGVTGTITILTEGPDHTIPPTVRFGLPHNPANFIETINWPVLHAANLQSYTNVEKVTILASPDATPGGTGPFQHDVAAFSYYYGAGPLGDFITTYILARNGPWYPTRSHNTFLSKFFNCVTVRTCLNSVEQMVTDGLSTLWNIPQTSSVIVPAPSILNCQYIFEYNNLGTYYRELGLAVYNQIKTEGVQTTFEVSSIHFTSLGTGFYDLGVAVPNSPVSLLENTKVVWKANPYSFLHLATNGDYITPGGESITQFPFPTFYRAVITIPNITPNINLNTITPGPDLLTTYISFSLYDLDTTNRNAFVWLGQAYTTTEDLAFPELTGSFAASGFSLLIVECICLGNTRMMSFNTDQVVIQANSNAVETSWQNKFAQIVSDIALQYTGQVISIDSLTSTNQICAPNNMCSDFSSIDMYTSRESPMVTVLETAAYLYPPTLINLPF